MPEKSLKSKSMRNPPHPGRRNAPLRKQEAPSAGAALRAAGKSESDYQSDGRPQLQQWAQKKPVGTSLQVSILSVSIADYSATGASVAAESVATAALSATVLSAATLSTTALSTAAESTASVLAVLLPQEAKEIAARATNMKTNFFILSLILNVKQSIAFIKTMQRYELFPYGVCLYPTFFQ